MRRAECLSRRDALALLGKTAVTGAHLGWLAGLQSDPRSGARSDGKLLDVLQKANCNYFWEQASPVTGLVKDRAAAQGADDYTISSIASTGFGLTSLCIAESRGLQPAALIRRRVVATLDSLLRRVPAVNGFFYHFMDMNTGARALASEVSSIDTAILLCGALTCRAYFQDSQISELAAQLYDRVNWPWMLNGRIAFSKGWTPEHGFFRHRWNKYSELMMLYLLAIGSRTNPIPASSWYAWARPIREFHGLKYIASRTPLFTHQFSHAWIDFRHQRDAFANYFANSVTATRAHKLFCLSLAGRFPDYGENLWGISSSDSPRGYEAWGGPPAMGPIDGTIVRAAPGGSVSFLPDDTLAVLQNIHDRYPRAWTRYGYINAFNPLTG